MFSKFLGRKNRPEPLFSLLLTFLAVLEALQQLPVEAHFSLLQQIDFLGREELFVLPYVFQLQLIGGDAGLNHVFHNLAVFRLGGIGIFSLAKFLPRLFVVHLFLVLQLEVEREEFLCLFVAQSRLLGEKFFLAVAEFFFAEFGVLCLPVRQTVSRSTSV